MNTFFWILIIVGSIVAIVLVVAAFQIDEYMIEREVVINKPKAEVFGYIKLQQNQNYYNKWVMADPAMKKEYKGTDGTVGFVYAWDSNNNQVGKGEQETVNLIDGKQIDFEVRFERPFVGTSNTTMITEPLSENQTKVKWLFKGRLNYQMKIIHLILNLKKALGKDMDKSLETLKNTLELK
jgi:hypothetical protein